MGKTIRFVILLLKSAALCLVIALALQTAVLFFFQDRIIYHRTRYASGLVEQLFPRKLVRLAYDSDGAAQVAFYAPPPGGGVPDHIWVFFSGNGGKVLEYGDLVSDPALAADGFLLVDYPGYGLDAGTPTPKTTTDSALAAIGMLAGHLGLPPADVQAKLNAVGHSLGAGAALDLAIADPAIRHVVLVAPFTSLCAMGRRMLGYPVCFLVRHNIDNGAALDVLATRDKRPSVTIFNGTADTIVPPSMGRDLAAAHPGWVEYHSIAGADHIDIVNQPRVSGIAQAMAVVERER